jgi:hypothetical protein
VKGLGLFRLNRDYWRDYFRKWKYCQMAHLSLSSDRLKQWRQEKDFYYKNYKKINYETGHANIWACREYDQLLVIDSTETEE